MATPLPELTPETERALAAGLYNDVWRLMDIVARTPAQDDEMLHAAHASRHHWARVGRPENLARGEWLCSRVYSVLGRPEPALHHAHRCLAILQDSTDGGAESWDLPAAYEALARANAIAGNRAETDHWLQMGRAALAAVAGAEDREPIEKDLASIEVPG